MINRRFLPWLGFVLLGLLAVALAAIPVIRAHRVSVERRAFEADSSLAGLKVLKAKNKGLAGQMRRNTPQGVLIIIDTGKNQLILKKGEKVLREAVVSSGSGNVLEDPGGQRSWVFDTPRGVFSVKAMIRDPYWVKPDWAFIEEDKPVPKRVDERIEGGVLGQYALSFGDGFFIHGTLYTRMLGRNVTHGCIRVGDADLEAVFRSSSVGTKIFIF